MIIILDPDIFLSTSPECVRTIKELMERVKPKSDHGMKIAVAKDSNSYKQFLDLHKAVRKGPFYDLIQGILQQLYDGNQILEMEPVDISSVKPHDEIVELNEPERTMVRMVEALKQEALILLAGKDAGSDITNRKLYDPPIVHAFRANGIELNIVYANKVFTQYPFDLDADIKEKKLNSWIFELLVKEKFFRQYGEYVIAGEEEYFPYLAEEDKYPVDFWGRSRDRMRIWYGECKLRFQEDIGLPLGLTNDKVREHVERVQKIRNNLPPGTTLIPFFVSNAMNIDKEKKRQLRDNGFHYLQAVLSPENWMEKERWKIDSLEIRDDLLGYSEKERGKMIPFLPVRHDDV